MKTNELNLDTLTKAVRLFITDFRTSARTNFCLVVGVQHWRLQHDVPRQPGARIAITSADNQSPP